jgi:hypothetical protein
VLEAVDVAGHRRTAAAVDPPSQRDERDTQPRRGLAQVGAGATALEFRRSWQVHARALHGPAWYPAARMTRVTNFGDPSFEPTDEELAELMREAFADVPVRSAAALSRIQQEIEGLRVQAMARLEQRLRGLK